MTCELVAAALGSRPGRRRAPPDQLMVNPVLVAAVRPVLVTRRV